MASYEVQIVGLKDFIAALKEVNKKYPSQVRKANRELVMALADKSKDLAASYSGYHRTERRVARSIRTIRSGSDAVLGMGRGHPEWRGTEWGAKKYKQFQYWRGNQHISWSGGPGYIVHPTIRDHADELLKKYAERLEEIYRIAFPE